MTTNLAARFLATGVLAAGFTAVSAVAGVVGSAHAATVTHAPGTRTVTLPPGNADLK